jgi:hypothetical protein
LSLDKTRTRSAQVSDLEIHATIRTKEKGTEGQFPSLFLTAIGEI